MRFLHTSSAGAPRKGRPRRGAPEDDERGNLSRNEREMVWQARYSPDREVCGALIAVKSVEEEEIRRHERLVLLRNVSPHDKQFQIANEDVIRLHVMLGSGRLSLRAIWHSHPGGVMLPSQADRRAHPAAARYMAIVTPDKSVHYYGRPDDIWEPMDNADDDAVWLSDFRP